MSIDNKINQMLKSKALLISQQPNVQKKELLKITTAMCYKKIDKLTNKNLMYFIIY